MLSAALLSLLLLAPETPLDEVCGQRALETVKVLAGDAFRGRKSGLESGRVAEEWMAAQARAAGLEVSFHALTATVTESLPGARLVLGGQERKYLADYVALMYSGSGEVTEAEVVFVGYGIHAPAKGRDDYDGLDVTDKVVLAMRGKPKDWTGEDEGQIGYKSSTALERGAIGFLLVEGARARPGTIQEKYHRETMPAAWISGAMGAKLLGRPIDKETAAGCKPRLLKDQRVSLTVRARVVRDAPMRNVMGVWKAKDGARHPEEYVICGAHLDHVGVDSIGNVYNGADDNASGSAVLLEAARAIAAKGVRFERNLMFVWFAGEEQGLIGSKAFVDKSPVPVEKMAAMFNADMVGAGKPTLVVGGAGRFPAEAAWLNGMRLDGIKVRTARTGGGSDHLPFLRRGVPSFFLITQGPHPHYHQPADDWDKLEPGLLAMTGRYMRAMAETVADAERPWCRPEREAEALWHAASAIDFSSGLPHIPEHGIDLRVVWLEGDAGEAFLAADRELTRTEDAKAGEATYRPHGKATIRNLVRDLKPTVLIGVRGALATTHGRPAVRLGAMLLQPDRPDAELCAFARERGAIVSFESAADAGDLIASSDCAALLTPVQAARFAKGRKGPWLAVYHLRSLTENKSTSHAEVAQEILDLRRTLGAQHLLVVPGDFRDQTYAAQAPTLHPGIAWQLKLSNLKPEEISRLLGGNLVNLIDRIRPRTP